MRPFPMEPHEVWPAVAVLLTLGAAVLLAELPRWLTARRAERERRAERLRRFVRARRPAPGWEPWQP